MREVERKKQEEDEEEELCLRSNIHKNYTTNIHQ